MCRRRKNLGSLRRHHRRPHLRRKHRRRCRHRCSVKASPPRAVPHPARKRRWWGLKNRRYPGRTASPTSRRLIDRQPGRRLHRQHHPRHPTGNRRPDCRRLRTANRPNCRRRNPPRSHHSSHRLNRSCPGCRRRRRTIPMRKAFHRRWRRRSGHSSCSTNRLTNRRWNRRNRTNRRTNRRMSSATMARRKTTIVAGRRSRPSAARRSS